MAMFTDTVTVYTKVSDTEWMRTVVEGVQWADKTDKRNENGKISVVKYAQITFPEGAYEDVVLEPGREEDAIFYGVVSEKVTTEKGSRLSDLLKKHPKSGIIQSVNDNSNRDFLKNVKVVIA